MTPRMKDAFVSIVTVCFNDVDNLKKTVEDVKKQTYRNLEHLIIDGGSNDGTMSYLQSVPNIKFKSESDKGLYDAMNKGISWAQGEYLIFLNAGDLFYDEWVLENIFNKSSDQDILYGKAVVTDRFGTYLRPYHKALPSSLDWRSFKMGMVVCHQALIVKKNLAQRFDINYKISADIDWAIRTCKSAKAVFNTGLVISRFQEGGLSSKKKWLSWKERFQIIMTHFGIIETLWVHILFIFQSITSKFIR